MPSRLSISSGSQFLALKWVSHAYFLGLGWDAAGKACALALKLGSHALLLGLKFKTPCALAWTPAHAQAQPWVRQHRPRPSPRDNRAAIPHATHNSSCMLSALSSFCSRTAWARLCCSKLCTLMHHARGSVCVVHACVKQVMHSLSRAAHPRPLCKSSPGQADPACTALTARSPTHHLALGMRRPPASALL